MKKILTFAYLFFPTVIAFAHGSAVDGHSTSTDIVAAADPSQRKYVLIVVVLVFLVMIGWFIWSKRKSSR